MWNRLRRGEVELGLPMSMGSEVAREAWDLAGPSSVGGATLASCKQHMEHIKKISKGVHSSAYFSACK